MGLKRSLWGKLSGVNPTKHFHVAYQIEGDDE